MPETKPEHQRKLTGHQCGDEGRPVAKPDVDHIPRHHHFEPFHRPGLIAWDETERR